MTELDRIINQSNAWREMIGNDLISNPPSVDECRGLFASICIKLSPENLHCDGEISNAEARVKAVALNKAWDELEVIFGRRVDEAEAYSW